MIRKLLTGNEAISLGAYEAGVSYASAYPGTPSTEILENIGLYKGEIIAEWAPNEKVALESAIGASVGGARSLAAMKHVGLNVAADPLFTLAYTGVNGGMLIISADDPGLHSSQNEQDNRHYARAAKMPMLEPSDSQEAKDMVRLAMEISEGFDVPVLMRTTTRVNHSKTLVQDGEKLEQVKKPYVKDLNKYDAVPAVSRRLHIELEKKLGRLQEYSNGSDLNFIEWNDRSVGIISSGISFQYAKEVFGEKASYLKIGMSYPLPMKKIREFREQVDTLYVIEELDPFMEDQIRAEGIACIGKELIPITGELNPDIIAEVLLGEKRQTIDHDRTKVPGRPPTLCAGCPHRGFFYELAKVKNIMIASDIGCYGLGGNAPLFAKDTCICMGGGVGMGHGAQKVFTKFGEKMRTVSVMGDSTFFHTGMNGILNSVFNESNDIICVLDNRTTGMTGHQENPGTGFTLQGDPTAVVNIPELVSALGAKNIRVINPIRLDEVREAIKWALGNDEVTVLITRWPCVLKKQSEHDRLEFGNYFAKCSVDEERCIGCRMCVKTGCPALQYDKATNKVRIDKGQCVGCEVCVQVCPVKAISRAKEVM